MKTRTYARVSLLIPFLVWGYSVLLLIVGSAIIPDDLSTNEILTPVAILGVFLLFYAVGILYWFIPYLVVSLVLAAISFKSPIRVLKYIYVLSPFVMAILIMMEVTFFTSPTPNSSLLSFDMASTIQDFVETGVLFAIVTLIWGYICVGLGFAVYILFQYLRIIQKEGVNFSSEAPLEIG